MKTRTLEPVWEEAYSFDVQSLDDAVMLEVWDCQQRTRARAGSSNELLGEVPLGTSAGLLTIWTITI